MKVSVIMSCHDRTVALRNTLLSWSKVDYPDWRLILIDNDSTQRKIINNLAYEFFGVKQLRYFVHASTSVNKMWNEFGKWSDGDYVIFAMADEIVTPDVITKMVSYGEQRCSVNTLFLNEPMTNAMQVMAWENDPKIIETLPGFWDFEYKGSVNRDKHDASLLSHIIGWTREKWEWFGWFRDDKIGHLWLDQDVVIRSRVLGIESKTVDGINCYHQWHEEKVDPNYLAPGYHPVNERQARLLEESERDVS